MQQHLPFTVCAEGCETAEEQSDDEVRTSQVPERREGKTKMRKQQHLPFTVLKPPSPQVHMLSSVTLQQYLPFTVLKHIIRNFTHRRAHKLQQHLPLAVCAEGCETAEEQSDDEVRTSQVPERREGKTKVISNSTYRLRYAPKGARQQRSKATMRPTYRKCLSKAKVKQR